MPNILFELDRLRSTLMSRGLDTATVENIVDKARSEIRDAFTYHSGQAMDDAVARGVDKRSPEFINELHLDNINMELTTDSGNMEFSTPPYPNLQNLLKNAKPMKDGSGVYKIIPVGGSGKERKQVSTSIYDAMKRQSAERAETAKTQYTKMMPKGSKGAANFRTATSKQNANTQWVIPAKEKDFSSDVADINATLTRTMDEVISDIIRGYEEGF